ncbi:hypothetical protein Q7A53_05560 [Halobacillus rhizosphaerae]|uniref:hypothetical protein n=1 Tax=Halobacillus rhizosphaerae TaxID=3064889 RepID=UPI00398BAFB4
MKNPMITVWSVVTDEGNEKHNHIEDGWAKSDKPLPKKKEFYNQQGWQKLEWTKQHGYLINGKVKVEEK